MKRNEMKNCLLLLALVSTTIFPNVVLAQTDAQIENLRTRTLTDPRKRLSNSTEDGVEPKSLKLMSNAIIIIRWMPAPDGTSGGYQIGGLDGYHSREQVERFLTKFYEADHQKETKTDRPNIVMTGNNWGAGVEMLDALRKLSSDKTLGIEYIPPWPFSKADLIAESEARKKLIEKAFKEANP